MIIYKQKLYQKAFDKLLPKHVHPNFPVPGVNYLDIFPIIRHFNFQDLTDCFNDITEPVVFVPESRGFLFYQFLGAYRCVPLRKNSKLPGELEHIEFKKEYGEDKLSFQLDALRKLTDGWLLPDVEIPVCFFDDVAATCGTARAIIEKINSFELDGFRFKVTSARFYVAIEGLGGIEKLREEYPSIKVESLYTI